MSVDTASPREGAETGAGDAPGRYLTDGRNLYRALGHTDVPSGAMVALEDCRSLEVVLLTPLAVARLDPVGESRRRAG